MALIYVCFQTDTRLTNPVVTTATVQDLIVGFMLQGQTSSMVVDSIWAPVIALLLGKKTFETLLFTLY